MISYINKIFIKPSFLLKFLITLNKIMKQIKKYNFIRLEGPF